jgi:hypothetical protein
VLPCKCEKLLAAGLDGMNGWLHKLKCNWSEERGIDREGQSRM